MRRAEPPRSRHPFRDTVIMYCVLALVIVIVGAFTGGGLMKAILVAVAFFVGATAWSWWRYSRRTAQERDG
jgi:membrane protein implicated in regulation of membrane protease activity